MDMSEFPFQLKIRCTPSNVESVQCTALIRTVPGRRRIYDSVWNEKNVIVKVFSHEISSGIHLKREWRGLRNLQKRGLSSPEPLFYGRTEDDQWAIVIEKILDSSTVLDSLDGLSEQSDRLNLLTQVCRELARQHSKGVLQKDLHLGNFLLADNKVYALDPGQMRFFYGELIKSESISQVALLLSGLPNLDEQNIRVLCEEYFNERGWKFEKSDEAILHKQIIIQTKKAIKRALKKSLRTSKRFTRIKTGKHTAVFDKDFCPHDNPTDLLEQIDSLMDSGQILKEGNTCYVSRFTWNEKDVVVKRYNNKGFFHSLRHTIKGSRARRSWLNAYRLGLLEISTPKPLAYIESYNGKLIHQSYIVTEYVQGRAFYYFIEDKDISKQELSEIIRQVIALLDELGKHKISHGDLKNSNILITESGPVITDLDAMKVHIFNQAYKARREKDLSRLINGKSGRSKVVDLTEIIK